MSNILVLAAHPDDEVLGCGATINKLASEGNIIKLMCFTDGVSSRGIFKSRQNKLDEVCNKLGINDLICGDFPDNRMDSVDLLDVVKFIESHIDRYPDIIFTHYQHCLNIDHSTIFRATLTAFRPTGKLHQIFSYFIPSSTEYNCKPFNGNFFHILTEEHVNVKLNTMKEYYSDEIRQYPHARSISKIKSLMETWGAEINVSFAEKFCLIRTVI